MGNTPPCLHMNAANYIHQAGVRDALASHHPQVDEVHGDFKLRDITD